VVKILQSLIGESPVTAGGWAGAAVDRFYTGGGWTLAEPLEEGFKFFGGTFSPDFHIPAGGISDPTAEAPDARLVTGGIAEPYALDPALNPGEKGGCFAVLAYFMHTASC
jgi:hypothetical protein